MNQRNKITISEWLEAFGQAEKLSTEVPKGWRTMADIAQETGRTVCATGKRVRALMAQEPPAAEMRKFLISTPTRGMYPTPHYRLIKSKPSTL